MSMLQMAAQLFMDKSGANADLDLGSVANALKNLLPSDGNDLDIGALISQFGSSNLTSMVGSWLGDGANQEIGGANITDVLGEHKVASFASELGIDSNQASSGLAGMIPELINKNSSGGSLLDSLGGAKGMAGFAKNLF
ncbi:MAG: DUF937 domain-containing protein [Gammaproteobacteria bacterium]|nr:DUF937 domain-containing protein [Gammaproteobacteria bacterium]